MKIKRARGLLIVVGCAIVVPTTARAQVEPSAEVRAVLERQSQRAQRSERGLAAFQQDLRPLAAAGEPVAQFLLGTLLVGSEPDTAFSYLTASAEAGCAGAAGILAARSRATAAEGSAEWLERAVVGGDAASMLVRATQHWRGDYGVQQSTAEALAWAQLARARSYSRGLTPEIDRMIGALRQAATPDEAAAADSRLQALESEYPKQPFYVCGQSVPSEG